MIKSSIINPLSRAGNKLSRLIMRPLIQIAMKTGRPIAAWLTSKQKETLPMPNLEGDREIEWSWVLAHTGTGPGEVLDFGCGDTMLSFITARKGYNVLALDLQPIHWTYTLPNMTFIRGDILKDSLPISNFDIIINCSSIEHVGLQGRYGSANNPEGDIIAMSRLYELTRPGGVMLLTIPVGRDALFPPIHRVYGPERLPKLLDRWIIEKKEFWIKDNRNLWISVEESEALDCRPTKFYYGLGCFVLRRNTTP